MNTYDIELPAEFRSGNDIPVTQATIKRERMEEIIHAAIEADRKTYNPIGERTIQQLHDVLLYLQNETMKLEAAYGSNFKKEATEKARAATEKMKEAVYAIKNIDRERRGEPVAYIRTISFENGEVQRDLVLASAAGDLSRYMDFVSFEPLYLAAPQPAESCVSSVSDKTTCGSASGDCDSQRAEPVRVPSVPEPLKYGREWKDHYVTGWNNCRAAMLAAEQAQQECGCCGRSDGCDPDCDASQPAANDDPTPEEEEAWQRMERGS